MIAGRLWLGRCALAYAALLPAPALAASAVGAPQAAAPTGPLKCEIGPFTMKLGGNAWLVHVCEDRASMAVVSNAFDPTWHYIFYLKPHAGAWEVEGVGDGNEQERDAARADLAGYSAADFERLRDEILQADFEDNFVLPATSGRPPGP
ncbi:MAG: hypothetical protein ABI240_13785 [Sphingomonas sp.]